MSYESPDIVSNGLVLHSVVVVGVPGLDTEGKTQQIWKYWPERHEARQTRYTVPPLRMSRGQPKWVKHLAGRKVLRSQRG